MILLLSISSLCFIMAFVHYLTKPIVSYLSAATWKEKLLLDQIKQLKDELEDIPMRSEYTKYVKTERKIAAVQTELSTMRSKKQTKNLALQYGIPYGTQFTLSFVLLVLSIVYRYTPVIMFDGQQFDLVPFGALLRFPTGIDGAVSVPFWIFVNSFVSKHLASYV